MGVVLLIPWHACGLVSVRRHEYARSTFVHYLRDTNMPGDLSSTSCRVSSSLRILRNYTRATPSNVRPRRNLESLSGDMQISGMLRGDKDVNSGVASVTRKRKGRRLISATTMKSVW